MKTHVSKRAALSLLIAGILCSGVSAQDQLLNDTQEILNSDQIDIDGTFRRESAADKVQKMRKRLEQQNEQMMQKKIEDIRINHEKELTDKLAKAFRGQMKAMNEMGSNQATSTDSVTTMQAAPQRVVAPMPMEDETKLNNKVIPFLGLKQYNGEEIDSFETNVSAGVTLENMVTDHFSVGLGFNYTTMDITDRNQFHYNYQNTNYSYMQGDEISYQNIMLSLDGKFFITKASKIKPYVGGSVAYNRTSLQYDDEHSYYNGAFPSYNGASDESKVTGSNVVGSAMVGAEVSFTDAIGLNLEFRYTRAITSAFDSSQDQFSSFNNDVAKNNLRTIGDNLEASDIAGLNLGLVVKF